MKIVELECKSIGEDVDMSIFSELGEFVKYELTAPEQIYERAKDADVIMINKLRIDENSIGNLPNLKLVCVTATGTDNVDIAYCKSRGIAVCNAKGYSTQSVVQHTFASFFYIYEKLHYYDHYVKDGEYTNCPVFTHFGQHFDELCGKVWGIVGLGEIGRGVAAVAKAFGCRVIYYSTTGKNNNSDYERVDLDTLLETSDIISIHSPLTDATRNLFNKQAFAKMKKTAYLVNVGRGPIVNDQDLVDALSEGQIAGAALDVLSKEPILADNPLLTFKDSNKLFVTPHIAWATYEARKRLMDEEFKNIKSFMEGGTYNRADLK